MAFAISWFAQGIVPSNANAEPTANSTETNATSIEILNRVCSTCHALETVTNASHTEAEWDDVIANMIDEGAMLSDEERPIILAYLTNNAGSNPTK